MIQQGHNIISIFVIRVLSTNISTIFKLTFLKK